MVRGYNTRKRCAGLGRCGVGERVANGGEGFAGAAQVAREQSRWPHHQKGGGVKKTTASELTLITGIGRVPLTRSQVAMWRQRVNAGQRRDLRATVR